MPAKRAASVRVRPSSTSANASIRRAAAASRLRPAAARKSAASKSVRVIATVIAAPQLIQHSESTPLEPPQFTIESAQAPAGIIRARHLPDQFMAGRFYTIRIALSHDFVTGWSRLGFRAVGMLLWVPRWVEQRSAARWRDGTAAAMDGPQSSAADSMCRAGLPGGRHRHCRRPVAPAPRAIRVRSR